MKQLAEALAAAQAFNQEEIDRDQALTATLHTRRYTAQDRRSFQDALSRGSAVYLYATNAKARRVWAAAFARHVLDRFGLRSDRPRLSEPVFLITLADRRYATADNGQEAVDLRSIAAWARQHLAGVSFIGMIEPAYYTNVGRYLGGPARLVSWHVHVLAWGVTSDQIERRINGLNADPRFCSLVPGRLAAHARKVPQRRLPHRIFYILKSPRSRYRIFPKKRPVPNPVTGELERVSTGAFEQRKDPLRPAERVRLLRLMHDLYLHHLVLAGGEGRDLLAAIKSEALAPLRRREQRSPRP